MKKYYLGTKQYYKIKSSDGRLIDQGWDFETIRQTFNQYREDGFDYDLYVVVERKISEKVGKKPVNRRTLSN